MMCSYSYTLLYRYVT